MACCFLELVIGWLVKSAITRTNHLFQKQQAIWSHVMGCCPDHIKERCLECYLQCWGSYCKILYFTNDVLLLSNFAYEFIITLYSRTCAYIGKYSRKLITADSEKSQYTSIKSHDIPLLTASYVWLKLWITAAIWKPNMSQCKNASMSQIFLIGLKRETDWDIHFLNH